MPKINALDELITIGTLAAEASIHRIENLEPWSPTLANAIREVSLWKLIKSDKLGKISKDDKIQDILKTMKRPVNIERDCIKTICKNLQVAQTQLKKVKQNAATHREDHLRQQIEEYELLGNMKMARHLRNLITIEQQKEVHQHISKFTKKEVQQY